MVAVVLFHRLGGLRHRTVHRGAKPEGRPGPAGPPLFFQESELAGGFSPLKPPPRLSGTEDLKIPARLLSAQ